jgi:nucleoside-diphosphate-sugar epimerase
LYSKSKKLAEDGLLAFAESSGMEVIILRPPLIYGPNAPGNFKFLLKLVKLTPILPFGAVNNKMSFLSIYNLIDLIHFLFEKETLKSAAYVVSDNELVSIKEFTNMMAYGLQKTLIQLPISSSLLSFCFRVIGKEQLISQLIMDSILKNDLLKKETGWSPRFSVKNTMIHLGEST